MEKQLENGLVIRSMSDEYREALPQFYIDVFTEAYGPEDVILGAWAADLVSPHHPTVTDDDVWMMLDQNNKILSALLLIPQVWNYEDTKIPVGRVELVGTRKEERHRSLTRTLMNVAHQRSADLGHMMQVITGIPYFYRKFGYTMAVKLGPNAVLPFSSIAPLKEGEQPKYTLRPATPNDIPDLMKWHRYYTQQVLLSVERLAHQWQYELTTRPMGTIPSMRYYVIVSQENTGVGYVGIRDVIFDPDVQILEYVVGDQASYLDTFDDVTRAIKQITEAKFAGTETQVSAMTFDNGLHPTIALLTRKSINGTDNQPTYGWYIRAESPASLMQHIAPVLERRLERSGAHCYTGELKINFYDKTGLVMKFEHGKLVEAVNRQLDFREESAAFPYHSFLNLVFGHHTVDDLQKVNPDAFARKHAYALLNILFPVRQSWVMGQL